LAVLWIKTQKVDILHVHAVGPGLIVPLARILGMKVVLTHHGQDYERQKWNWLAKSVLRMGEMLGSRFSNSVIAISEVIDDLLQEKYSINNSVLIYNGVTKLPIIPRSSYLNELGIGSEPYVVAVARFVPEKGLHDLLSAMSEPQFPDINVVLVGDSDHPNTYSEKLKEEALNKGVRLTGFISGDRLAEVFSNASLFVMPSYHEGLPISLLEAINYKLPVLVSDIKANLEVGLPEECYFPVGDSKKIAEKLGSAIDINLDYESLSCKYNWDDIAEKTNRLYLNIG
jgi:glycosyltransferase involved in cell wall biosynthesis